MFFSFHKSDEYFKSKFSEQMNNDSYKIICEAYHIRHQYPHLSGPELIRLVYFGNSGTEEGDTNDT